MVDFLAGAHRPSESNARSLRARRRLPLGAHLGMELTRNRSLDGIPRECERRALATSGSLVLREEEKAIDPSLHVLQLEALDPTRKRMLGAGGMAGVLPPCTRPWSGPGIASSARMPSRHFQVLEAELRRAWAIAVRSGGT